MDLRRWVLSAQVCLYGGANQDFRLGDVWIFDGERLAWEQTEKSDFGGFSGAAKAWHAAAVLESTEVRHLYHLPSLEPKPKISQHPPSAAS